ncbi:hypothetical protein WJX72_007578 [[Myrmecia] bisecta]|uniref:Aquaporin n=1 Tax=[Myrmecia] bisecta TaxID=41462 RepID=A0AAW1R7Z2_9CHLO
MEEILDLLNIERWRGADHLRADADHNSRMVKSPVNLAPPGLSPIEIGVKFIEPISGGLIKAVLAEFVCFILFLFFTIGTICFGCHLPDINLAGQDSVVEVCALTAPRVLTIATAFGLSIFVLVYASASFSGGHLNPAITLGFLITKKVTLLRAVLYWAAQITGGIIGVAFVKAVDKVAFAVAKGGTNGLTALVDEGGGWLMETILTFALVFVVFAATDAARAENTAHLPVLAPMAIGFTVFICHLVAIPIDGCSINPARSFAAAVVYGKWNDMWIFWVGPFSGAIIAALTYELVFRPTRKMVRGPDGEMVLPTEQGPEVTAPVAKLPPYSGEAGLSMAHDVERQATTGDMKTSPRDYENGR